MAIPVFLFVVEGFLRRPKTGSSRAPFISHYEGFANAAEARTRFDALVEQATALSDPDSPVQAVSLKRHKIDVEAPLALLAAVLVTRHPLHVDPPWAVSTKLVARYRERNPETDND